MKIKEGVKINSIEMSAPVGKKYFDVQIDDTVERVYLMESNDVMLSRVFVVNKEHKAIQISGDVLLSLDSEDYPTCDLTYDTRKFSKSFSKSYVRDIFLIMKGD